MKNTVIRLSTVVALLAFILPMATMAQEKVWSFGPEAGLSFSKYSNNNYKPGGIGGAFLTYSIQNTFGVSAKLLLYQKGATVQPGDTRRTLEYIEIPVVGRFFLIKEGSFRPNIFAGPSFGFLSGAANKVGDGERVRSNNYKSEFKPVDVGVTAGLGLNFLVYKETYFIMEARYIHGLSDITTANGNVNNRSIGLTAGVSFGF